MPYSEDFVPATIEQAVDSIVDNLEEQEKQIIIQSDPANHHFQFGMSMRNNWSLWEKETPIKRDAVEKYKIAHADDLSGLIMEWVWAKVNQKEFDPVSYCERFHTHWRQFGISSLEAGGYNNDGTPQED